MVSNTKILEWLAEVELDRAPLDDEIPTETDLAVYIEANTSAVRTANTRLRALWTQPSETASWTTHANGTGEHDDAHVRGAPECRLYALVRQDEAQGQPPPEFADLAAVHARWFAIPEAQRPAHPVAPLVAAWLARPKTVKRRHIIVPAMLGMERPLTRAPAWLDVASFAEIEAIEVDGEPIASRTAAPCTLQRKRRYRRRKTPTQDDLLPAPRTLAGHIVGDVVLDTLAQYPLTGDERSPIRWDIYRLGLAGFALSGAVELPAGAGAHFIGGRDSLANRKRWWTAAEALNGLTITIDPATREWRNLAVVDVRRDGTVVLCGPAWWRGEDRWRLAGGLFRPVLLDDEAERGTNAGYWGALQRTIASFEAALAYGPCAGRGRDGRIPDALRPGSGLTGPGPWVFIPWLDVLRRAGEHIDTEAGKSSAEARRWDRRRKALVAAGYTPTRNGRGAAPAGDTIEITVQRGSRGHPAGLWVRASARFVEATRKAHKDRRGWTRLAATQLFAPTTMPRKEPPKRPSSNPEKNVVQCPIDRRPFDEQTPCFIGSVPIPTVPMPPPFRKCLWMAGVKMSSSSMVSSSNLH